MKHERKNTSAGMSPWARMLGALLFFATSGAWAATVGFNLSTTNVTLGQTFNVDIIGSSFADLSGGSIDLGFDSSRLLINSVAVNPYFDFLPSGGGPASGDTWPGIGFDTFANPPASGNFTIATINFKALAEGSAFLNILGSSQFFDSNSTQLSPTLSPGTVNVAVCGGEGCLVPVPGALWLFGSGLLGLAGVARRKVG